MVGDEGKRKREKNCGFKFSTKKIIFTDKKVMILYIMHDIGLKITIFSILLILVLASFFANFHFL